MMKKSKIDVLVIFGFLLLMALTVIFTLDPLEKQKEKRDVSLKNAASKILSAIENSVQKKGRLPWSDSFASDNPYPALAWTRANSSEIGVCKDKDCLLQGELVKQNFLDASLLDKMVEEIYLGKGSAPKDSIFACFIPSSKKERKKVGELYHVEVKNPLSPTNPSSCEENLDFDKDNPCQYCLQQQRHN